MILSIWLVLLPVLSKIKISSNQVNPRIFKNIYRMWGCKFMFMIFEQLSHKGNEIFRQKYTVVVKILIILHNDQTKLGKSTTGFDVVRGALCLCASSVFHCHNHSLARLAVHVRSKTVTLCSRRPNSLHRLLFIYNTCTSIPDDKGDLIESTFP